MRIQKYSFGILLCLFVLGGVGCRRVEQADARERNNRIVLKAYELSDKGEYDSAVLLFTKALETYPKLARPHLDLAILLHERKEDQIRAVYHYKRYLELRPSSDKKEMIEGQIRKAEAAFVAQYSVKGASLTKSTVELEAENRALKDHETSLMNRVKELESELAEIREAERVRYKATVVGESDPAAERVKIPVAPEAVEDAPLSLPDVSRSAAKVPEVITTPVKKREAEPLKPKNVSVSTPVAVVPEKRVRAIAPADPERRTYTVRQGDSLSKIALKVYGDAAEWPRLRNANRKSLGASDSVKVGQVLEIP